MVYWHGKVHYSAVSPFFFSFFFFTITRFGCLSKIRWCVCILKSLRTFLEFYIIISRCQLRSPWPSLSTRLYRPSLPGGLPDYSLYPQRAVIYIYIYIGSTWSSCLCSSMWGDPQEYITYEFGLTSPAVSPLSSKTKLTWSTNEILK